jgi:hypothetical protein
MAKRKSAAWWRAAIKGWKESGDSVRGYCSRRGIARSTFYWRRRRLAEEADARPRFVPVRLAALTNDSAGIEVLLRNGRRLRLDRGFDASALREAVAALEAAAC